MLRTHRLYIAQNLSLKVQKFPTRLYIFRFSLPFHETNDFLRSQGPRIFIFLHDCTGFIAAARVIFSNAFRTDRPQNVRTEIIRADSLCIDYEAISRTLLVAPVVLAPPEELARSTFGRLETYRLEISRENFIWKDARLYRASCVLTWSTCLDISMG